MCRGALRHTASYALNVAGEIWCWLPEIKVVYFYFKITRNVHMWIFVTETKTVAHFPPFFKKKKKKILDFFCSSILCFLFYIKLGFFHFCLSIHLLEVLCLLYCLLQSTFDPFLDMIHKTFLSVFFIYTFGTEGRMRVTSHSQPLSNHWGRHREARNSLPFTTLLKITSTI